MKYYEAKYLKHVGKLIDVKVSIRRTDNGIMIYIRDYRALTTLRDAVRLLRRIAEAELTGADKMEASS